MLGGALVVAAGLLLLGWTGEIVRTFVSEPESVSGKVNEMGVRSSWVGL